MSDQFNFEALSDAQKRKEDIRSEILYEWPAETRNAKYKLLIGQEPKLSMTEEQITDGILDPEREKMRIISENREDDQQDTVRPWRK